MDAKSPLEGIILSPKQFNADIHFGGTGHARIHTVYHYRCRNLFQSGINSTQARRQTSEGQFHNPGRLRLYLDPDNFRHHLCLRKTGLMISLHGIHIPAAAAS